MRYGMSTLNGADDALGACQILECVYRFIIGHGHVLRASDIMQIGMLRSNAGIIQTCRDGIYRCDLSIFILTEIRLHAVEDAETARSDRRSGQRRIHALAGCLTADQLHFLIFDEIIESTHGIAAAAHAGNDCRRKLALCLQDLLLHFLADHALEVTHDHGEGMRSHHGTQAVMRVIHAICPLAHRLIHGILQSHRAAGHGMHLRAEKLHAINVQRLTIRILLAHEDLTLHAKQRCCRRRRNAVLSRARLRDQSRLPHLLCEKRLTKHVVDLMRSRVIQILTL